MNKKQAMKDFFSIFQEGYTKREVAFLDPFMDTFFEEGVNISVIGTGNNEIYTTKEEVRELFEGDWLYWGDLLVKTNTLTKHAIGSHDIFVVQGDLTYTFEDNEQTVPRYHKFIKEIIEEATDNVDHINHQHMKAHFVLDHFLHKRETSKRTNVYPIIMVFVCEEVDTQYKIRALTFTNPPAGDYPDERIHQFTGYDKDHETSLLQLHEKGEKTQLPSIFSMEKADDFMFVDLDGTTYTKEEAVKNSEKRFNDYEEILVNEDVGLMYQKDGLFACSYIGRAVKVIEEEKARKDLQGRIKETLSSDKDLKDQLFIIRREMSILNKEQALGTVHDWPCRIFAVIKRVEDKFVLHMLQFGYPMDMILEDKHL